MEGCLDMDAVHPLSLTDVVRRHWLPEREVREDVSDELSRRGDKVSTIFSVAMGIKRKNNILPIKIPSIKSKKTVREQWKEAASRALQMGDPWEPFHLELLPTETALRYRYNALKKSWVVDQVVVKIAHQPFSHGAMRECFRMKKLSNFCHSQNWKSSSNYVAKRYMDDVERQTYFEDVRLQMDGKLWSEEYNRHKPPKKVDIMQVCVIEFIARENKPLYHLEHFIEGHYVKYNSNSGFISCENIRLTPQAFSHFTFERSGHELLVVDIQGVGDLYTDPQIHTACGLGYGEGNLGPRGMALFFHSHVCNHICRSLGLTPFDISASEKKDSRKMANLQQFCQTQVRGTEELCISPSDSDDCYLALHFQHTSLRNEQRLSVQSNDSGGDYGPDESVDEYSEGDSTPASDYSPGFFIPPCRRRYESESSFGNDEEDKMAFQDMAVRKARPSCVQNEVLIRQALDKESGDRTRGKSVLGQIHLALCQYHEAGRFSADPSQEVEEYDQDAALFHLEHSAKCGSLEAIMSLAQIYLQLPHSALAAVSLPENQENTDKGLDLMQEAAACGEKTAMVFLAKRYDTGQGLGSRERSWSEAVLWYDRAVSADDSNSEGDYGGCLEDANYLLLAREAEMYQEGGYTLDRDCQKAGDLYTQAAEEATAAMKGRLANKYYLLAEQVWSQVEE